MVGHVQQLSAAYLRERKARARAAEERGGERDRPARKRASRTEASLVETSRVETSWVEVPPRQPPLLPLDEAEADLCERLTGLLSKAPRRCCDEAPSAQIAFSDRIATVAEVVPEPAELPPLRTLPTFDPATAAPTMHSIKWMQRSRRERLKTALGYSAAWTVTIAVIAVTVGGAIVLTLGAEKSADLAAKASKHSMDIATTAVAGLKLLIGK